MIATPEMFEHLGPILWSGLPPGFADGLEQLIDETTDFEHADLGFTELSNNLIGAHGFRIKPSAENHASPWHVHHLAVQIGILTSGFVRLEVEGVGEVKHEPGQLINFPPGVRHRELEMAPGTEGFEITIPAKYRTTFFVFDEVSGSYKDVELYL
jgi:hypothetical protein